MRRKARVQVASSHRPGGCRAAFTLIELLVVISVVALLMALLFPVLARARRQAQATACQARLRQWGLFVALYIADNDGRLPPRPLCRRDALNVNGSEGMIADIYYPLWPYWWSSPSLLLCPSVRGQSQGPGGTLWAWKLPLQVVDSDNHVKWGGNLPGGYGGNQLVGVPTGDTWSASERACFWQNPNVQGATRIPLFFDCAVPILHFTALVSPLGLGTPPPYDTADLPAASFYWCAPESVCMERHRTGINSVFLDGSVRRVGLKELWTLKWHRQYDTANCWTKAGGVAPDDWPVWMRGFKDY